MCLTRRDGDHVRLTLHCRSLLRSSFSREPDLRMRRSSAIPVVLLLAGCYAYHPTTPAAIGIGSYVRAELTDAGAASVQPAIGTSVLWIEGEVREANERGLTLALRTVNRRDFGESSWNGETVSLTAGDIRFLNERVLSRGRTTAMVSALSVGGLGLIYAIAHATGLVAGSTGRPPPPPP